VTNARRLVVTLCLVLAPLACDAFSAPTPPPSFDDGISTEVELFCPRVSFPQPIPSTALSAPLFAWITREERDEIEAGGPILRDLALSATESDALPANMQNQLLRMLGSVNLVGQPRVGRSFWPFAFSAPRASVLHDQLLSIELRADAWFANYATSGVVHDATGEIVAPADALASPGRIAGIDSRGYSACDRGGHPERSFVVFREEAIERITFGAEPHQALTAEIQLLQQMLGQLRQESQLNPTNAFDDVRCGSLLSFGLCSQNTYILAVAWHTPTYLPTIGGLSALIDELRAILEPASFVLVRSSSADAATWMGVWPGDWALPDGAGGAGGAGGMGGSGG